jgi:hypothetical protein
MGTWTSSATATADEFGALLRAIASSGSGSAPTQDTLDLNRTRFDRTATAAQPGPTGAGPLEQGTGRVRYP